MDILGSGKALSIMKGIFHAIQNLCEDIKSLCTGEK
jgi:hypothetical protein